MRPEDVGLPSGGNRRTPGLRREEVAQLARISVDYYVRLEQARGPHPSPQVLESLSQALRLSAAERSHLFHLAGSAPRPGAGPRSDVPAGILHLLDRLDDSPAVVVDAKYDVLAWNPMWAALMSPDPSGVPPARLNSLRGFFAPEAAAFAAEHVEFGRQVVADLRAAAARYPDDVEIRRLISDLSTSSVLFGELWKKHEINVQRSTSKHIDHPVVGEMNLDCETLYIPDRDQRLVLYTAVPGSPSHQALALLKVVGLQNLSSPG